MKKIKSTFSIIMYLIITLFVTSCSDAPATLSMIPKSSPYVSIVNVGSLLQKGHMDNMESIKEFKFFKKLKRLVSEDTQLRNIYKDIEEDPSITGVDFSSDLVTFAHVISKKEIYACNAFELNDSDNFEKFTEDLVKKSNEEYVVEEDEGIKYLILGNENHTEMIISWDSKRALVAITPNRVNLTTFKREVKDLMTLKSEQNLTNNKSFSTFLENKKDVSLWLSVDNLDSSFGLASLLRSLFLPKDTTDEVTKFLGKNICFSSHLNFENEHIKLSNTISPKESLKEFDFYKEDFNSDILKYLPKESYFLAGISLDLNKAHTYLGTQKKYLKIMNKIAENLKIDPDAFVNSLGGTAVLNVHSYEKVKYSYLGYGYTFDETKAKKFDKLYPIGDVNLNDEDKEKLNKGETISVVVNGESYKGYEVVETAVSNNKKEATKYPSPRFPTRNKYSMNIKNILAKGGTIEAAIKDNSLVNFYDGGMEYAKNVEQTTDKELPLYTFIMDIKDSKEFEKLFNSEEFSKEFSKKEGYYKLNDRDLVYVSINENTFLITNDIKVVEKHKDGGFSDNLGDSPLASNLKNNPFYLNMNFDYDTYSDSAKNVLESKFKKGFTTKSYDLVFDFVKIMELKTINNANSEFIISTQKTDENSLYNLIKTLDDGLH